MEKYGAPSVAGLIRDRDITVEQGGLIESRFPSMFACSGGCCNISLCHAYMSLSKPQSPNSTVRADKGFLPVNSRFLLIDLGLVPDHYEAYDGGP